MENNYYLKTRIKIKDIEDIPGLSVFEADNYYIEDIYGNIAICYGSDNTKIDEIECDFRIGCSYALYQLIQNQEVQIIGMPQIRKTESFTDALFEETTETFIHEVEDSGVFPLRRLNKHQNNLKNNNEA